MSTNIYTKPTLPRAGQWIAEALAGSLVGVGLAAGAGFAGARAFAGSASGWGDLIAAVLGALIGYTIGVSIGVALVGRLLGRRGSFWPALAGSVVGAALVLLLAEPLKLNANPALFQLTIAAAAAIVATLTYNVGLRWKR